VEEGGEEAAAGGEEPREGHGIGSPVGVWWDLEATDCGAEGPEGERLGRRRSAAVRLVAHGTAHAGVGRAGLGTWVSVSQPCGQRLERAHLTLQRKMLIFDIFEQL